MYIVLNEICKSSAMIWIRSSMTAWCTKPQICSSKTASRENLHQISQTKFFYISEQLNFKHIPNKATEHLWLKPNGFCNNFIYISVNKEKMCYNVLMLIILFTNRRGPMGTRYTPASGHFFILNPTWSSFENHQVSGNPKFSGMPNISGLCAISGLA